MVLSYQRSRLLQSHLESQFYNNDYQATISVMTLIWTVWKLRVNQRSDQKGPGANYKS